jgi:positive regulator of sigma E activity
MSDTPKLDGQISLADHREAMRMAAVGYVRELAEARRQVAVLVSMAMFATCAHCDAKDFCDNQPAATACDKTIAAWAAQRAKEG